MSKIQHIPFDNSGDFLRWWFETRLLEGKALQVFERYYSNYRKDFNGYLREAWTDRHFELDREISRLKDRPNPKILDLGCGTGSVSLYIAGKLRNKCEVMGVDINDDRLLCARERQRILEEEIGRRLNCTYRNQNILSLDDKKKYDLVYLEETLHHMEPRLAVAKKISELIKDTGFLIVSEANAYNPLIQLNLFKKRGFRTIRREIGKNGKMFLYGDERIMTAKRVAELFESNGFRVKSLRYFRMASSKLGKQADRHGFNIIAIEHLICKVPIFRHIFSAHFNIVLMKS